MKRGVDSFAEFRLVAACCQWPPSERRNESVAHAGEAAIDWLRFVKTVDRHRVAGLVHQALSAAAVEMPADVAASLSRSAQKIAIENVRLAAESARLQTVFDAAGIPVVFFKGVSLAQRAYGSLSLKHGKDIDLLVPVDRAEAALQLLEREEYALWQPAKFLSPSQRRAVIKHSKEFALIGPDGRTEVELHWKLTYNPMLLRNLGTSSDIQNLSLSGGLSIRTFADTELFAYLCAHGAAHAWFRFKWLADFNALIAEKGEAEIERFYRAAEGRGTGLCAGQALLLANRLLGLKLPSALEIELRKSRRLLWLVNVALDAMTASDAEAGLDGIPFFSTRLALLGFLQGGGYSYFLAHFRHLFVGTDDIVRHPLPSRLHFLYPILRLPLWIWRRARNRGLAGPR